MAYPRPRRTSASPGSTLIIANHSLHRLRRRIPYLRLHRLPMVTTRNPPIRRAATTRLYRCIISPGKRWNVTRDRVFGTGHFVSSQLSVNPPQPPLEEAPPPSATKQPAQLGLPPAPATPQKAVSGADYNMRLSRLPAPESLYYSKMSCDTSSPVTPSPTTATFQHQQQQPRFRARDAGLPIPKPGDLSLRSPVVFPQG